MTDTKSKILAATEHILADRGFENASLRAITAAAGVNLAAVNYYFRSKEGLIQAVLTRRLEPINRERLILLEACERRAGRNPVPAQELVRALIAPMVHAVLTNGRRSQMLGRIIAGLYMNNRTHIQHLLVAELAEVFARFVGAFRRSLPDIPEAEIAWRLFFTVGSTVHYLAASGVLQSVSGGRCDPADVETAIHRLVAFGSAGMTASPQSRSRRQRRAEIP